MRRFTRHRGPRPGRLARRLVWLFLGAALLPVVLSDWLSIDVMTQVAERFDRESRQQTTRQVSRQVLERLLAAKAVLAAAVPTPMAPATARVVPAIGPGGIFRTIAFPGSGADADADITLLWQRAAPAPQAAGPRPRGDDAALHIELRTFTAPAAATRLLLGARAGAVLVGVAELSPDFVWAPVANADEDAVWSVHDALGQPLLQRRGADVAAPAAPPREFEARLFLAGELGSGSWSFVQRAPAPLLLWHGVPLAGWLGAVALATLLVVGLYSGWKIRRVLAPLEALTDGTRRLAAGVASTRVAVAGDDEISAFGNAFNDMAAELETQFAMLRNLADIDAGILAGTPLHDLAQRVSDQLLRLYPQSAATVLWREGPRTLRTVVGRADATATAGTTADVALTSPQAEHFDALSDGDRIDAVLVDPRAPAAPGAMTHPVVMTIQEAGRTRAAIVLRLPPAPPAAALKPARDLTDRLAVAFVARGREQELVYRAAHDELTGLANSYGLQNELERLLAQQCGAALAVLFIDLDQFKDVNDRHGHGVGDELLRLTGARIRACLPDAALLARKGGDEFVVVLPGAQADAARATAARILDALAQPATLRGIAHSCGASIGVALSPEHGTTREELLRCADVALYVAKDNGRSRQAVFSASFDNASREQASLLAALRVAVARSELVVHYQPRLRASDGVITSAEALVRWQHPQRGLLMPGSFIELAEASGLIGPIGEWVLDRACAQIAQWQRQGLGLERVSVNVSARQLVAGDLPGKVGAALARHAVAAHRLELEVTESLMVGDVRAASVQLAQIRRLGVTIAMDDFGTGHSSLALLRKLPIDVLKVDRAFVTDMATDPSALAVTRTIVTLAKSLALRLVAEGIETEPQAALLRSMGCDEFQGYLYGKPVAAPDFARLPRTSLYQTSDTAPPRQHPRPTPLQGHEGAPSWPLAGEGVNAGSLAPVLGEEGWGDGVICGAAELAQATGVPA